MVEAHAVDTRPAATSSQQQRVHVVEDARPLDATPTRSAISKKRR